MLFIWFLLFSYLRNSTSLDSLAPSQSIRDSERLVSKEGTFEAGFFSPGTSTRRYLGIWYRDVSPLTVVWVANREKPVYNKSGVLKLEERGGSCVSQRNKMGFTKTELKGQVELYLKVNINEYSEIVCSSKILTKKIKNSN